MFIFQQLFIYSKIKNLVTKVRDGLFLASSRSYGEQYVEPFIREKYELSEPKTNDNDGTDKDGKRYEIKSCKVLRATSNGKKLKTILDRILFETENVETGRLIPFSECETAKYLANVQNVKRDYFDSLGIASLFCRTVRFIT